jgi:hypothetical protein
MFDDVLEPNWTMVPPGSPVAGTPPLQFAGFDQAPPEGPVQT